MSIDQKTVQNPGSLGNKTPSTKIEPNIDQSPKIVDYELPPIIEYPKVFLCGQPKRKDQDSDCTRSSGSFEDSFDDFRMLGDGFHDLRRNIMFNRRIVFNLNNHPRFLSESINRVRTRMANEDTSE